MLSISDLTSKLTLPDSASSSLQKVDNHVVSRGDTCVSHGSISIIGRRRSMDVTVTIVPAGIQTVDLGIYDYFAVYYGGSGVAQAFRDRMHVVLASEVEVEGMTRGGRGGVDWRRVMRTCFKKMDAEVGSGVGDEKMKVDLTAAVMVVGKEDIVIANWGGSKAVLGRRGGVIIPLSREHKAGERVEEADGPGIIWNDYRETGFLATSRSTAEESATKPYVMSEPEITVSERTESDEFIVVGSDGLWDVLSSRIACEVVKRCLQGQVKSFMEAAAMLAALAIAKGSKGNISVIVVELNKLS